MGKGKRFDYEELATTLFEELVSEPDGLTMEQIIERLELNDRFTASKVISTLRIALGDGDTITVPVIRKGMTFTYRLSGSLDQCQNWLMTRARYMATRLKSDAAATASLTKGLDGRTHDGRTVRRLRTSAERLVEDAEAFLEEAR